MDADIETRQKLLAYLLYISMCSFVTAVLNVVHTVYVLKISLTAASFAIPMFAGLLFGLMLARIRILSEILSTLAYTDPLTHIYNRLHFAHFLDAETERVKRYGGTFSIIFFDLDHFKEVNDNFGHPAGDEVLEKITKVVSNANRSSDIFARYGGEEFIILTPETNLSGAEIHAGRLCRLIKKYKFKKVGHVTCSFGIAEFNAEKDDVESLLERADKALYVAKDSGRNRVETATL